MTLAGGATEAGAVLQHYVIDGDKTGTVRSAWRIIDIRPSVSAILDLYCPTCTSWTTNPGSRECCRATVAQRASVTA